MDKNGSLINLFYELPKIGGGSFGNCCKVIHLDSGLIATKKKSELTADNLEKYTSIHKSILAIMFNWALKFLELYYY